MEGIDMRKKVNEASPKSNEEKETPPIYKIMKEKKRGCGCGGKRKRGKKTEN